MAPRSTHRPDMLRSNERGVVIIPAFALMMTMVMLTLILTEMTTTAVKRVSSRAEDARLAAAADTAIDLSMHELWVRSVQASEGEPPNLEVFRGVLDGLRIDPLESSSGGPGIYDPLTYEEPEWGGMLGIAGLPLNENGAPNIDGSTIEALEAVRADEEECDRAAGPRPDQLRRRRTPSDPRHRADLPGGGRGVRRVRLRPPRQQHQLHPLPHEHRLGQALLQLRPRQVRQPRPGPRREPGVAQGARHHRELPDRRRALRPRVADEALRGAR